MQRLLKLRAERTDLRTARMEHLQAGEQSFVYRRGRTVVALNNDTTAVTIRLPISALPDDALGVCAKPRAESSDASAASFPPKRLRILTRVAPRTAPRERPLRRAGAERLDGQPMNIARGDDVEHPTPERRALVTLIVRHTLGGLGK